MTTPPPTSSTGKRGWFGFNVGSYYLATLFGEALPPISAALWGLLAVMFAAQTFAGDRADGTDRFLLDRPVPRRATWLARVLASLASALVVVLGNALYIAALVSLVRAGAEAQIYTPLMMSLWVGIGLAVLGTIGGMAAGDMVRTPMQAVLIGVVLTALPIGAAMFFFSVFEFAQIQETHLAFLVTPILPVALVLVSYRAGCLGEPAGGGRIKRGLVVLAIALVLTPVLFAAVAPFAVRAGAAGGWPQGTATAADRTVSVGGWYEDRGGWMLDTATGDKIRFLPPPLRSVAWKADGSMLAVIHQAGMLGSIGNVRLDLIDASGATQRSFDLEEGDDSYAQDVQWAGDLVLVREWLGFHRAAIRVIDPAAGVVGSIDIDGDEARTWRVLGPTDDGSVYLHRLVGKDPRTYELNRMDLESLRLEKPLLTESGDLPTYTPRLLSPSGRYLARETFEDEDEDKDQASHVFDLQTGERIDYPGSMIAGWLSGDRLLRLDRDGENVRVVLQRIGGEELLSRSFGQAVSVKPSPDGEKFFLTRRLENNDRWYGYSFYPALQGSEVEQFLVCDGAEWTDLQSLIEGLDGENVWVAWGGPNTLMATNGTSNAVAEPQSGARWKAVLGRWP